MKSNLYILILLFAFPTMSQENRTEEVKDYDKDGIADTLKTLRDSGSGYGGRSCTIINGKTGEVYKLEIWGSFGNIRHTMPVPENLTKTENKAFLDRINQELLSPIKDKPDPSLQWVIDANLSASHKKDSLFDLAFFPNSKWIQGTPEFPTSYTVKVDQNVFSKLYATDEEPPEWYDSKTTNGYLLYFGINHCNFGMRNMRRFMRDSSFFKADSNDIYSVMYTGHGLVAQKGNTYKWIFVTDAHLTSGPEKLRWNSIGTTTLYDKYVIFQHHLSPSHYNHFYIIDLETGVCARLFELGIDFKVDGANLMIEIDNEESYMYDSVEVPKKYLTIDLNERLKRFNQLKPE